nr:immunoglobulin light chain junction region [Macaca mulatta]MOY04580.1 immunoglobulin light chain junction region [Macaca mulatta]
CQQFASYPLTF